MATSAAAEMYNDPAYFNGAVYEAPPGEHLRRYVLNNGLLSQHPVSQSSDIFKYPGSTPSISSNGDGERHRLDAGRECARGIRRRRPAGRGCARTMRATLQSNSTTVGTLLRATRQQPGSSSPCRRSLTAWCTSARKPNWKRTAC